MLGWGSLREHGEVAATTHSELITCRWQPRYLQPSANQRILHVCERGYCDSDAFKWFWQLVSCQCYNQPGGTKEIFQCNYEKFPRSSVKIFASHTNQGFNLYLGDSNELRVMIMDSNSLAFYLLWLFFFLPLSDCTQINCKPHGVTFPRGHSNSRKKDITHLA